ncbi:MAG: ABC transporter ATP-binding protein, partial [Aldersonia sp.]|nr:ABC transporter ATP-binding protein [Aldersonia sp.]
VYVTHDQVEAMTMGDRVAVLRDGVLQQCATPQVLYRHPQNVFVAGFMGSPAMNLFTLPITDRSVTIGGWRLPVPRTVADAAGADRVTVGIRPEHFEIGEGGFEIEVAVVEELGADAFLYGHALGYDEAGEVVARADWRNPPAKGSTVRLTADPEHVHFFAADGRRIS